MRLILCSASVVLASSSFAGAPNDLLFMQAPAEGVGFISSTEPGGDFTSDDVRTADSVQFGILPPGFEVYRIDWWGGDQTDGPSVPLSNIASFNIRGYNVRPGQNVPGSLTFEFNVDIADTNPTLTGNTVGFEGAPEFHFSLASDELLFLQYVRWFSISANYHTPPGLEAESFLWSSSLMGDGIIAQDDFGDFGYQLAGLERRNAAFAFYGLIPTPGAAALLCVAGVMGSRRRR